MSATQRYTGANCTIIFNGVTVSNDYTELEISATQRVEERTAAADTDASYNTTIKEGKASLKIFDLGENGVSVTQALLIGQSGSLQVFTKGNTSGKPKYAAPYLVTDFKEPIGFDKNVMIDIELLKNGAATSDFGTLA